MTRVQWGDVWRLGKHVIACGNSTDADLVRTIMDGAKIDAILTDPPYASSGFAGGWNSGSKGTTSDYAPIMGDKMSARGYKFLMRAALRNIRVDDMYVFTDWRMWVDLYEVLSELSYAVRGMIVWDKVLQGLGRKWRTQHELICWSTSTQTTDRTSRGNVITMKRQPNTKHPTEKPVLLLVKILEAVDGPVVYDPFIGSGSTLLAAEQLGKTCYGVEMEPKYCDAVLERWTSADNLMGEKRAKPVRICEEAVRR